MPYYKYTKVYPAHPPNFDRPQLCFSPACTFNDPFDSAPRAVLTEEGFSRQIWELARKRKYDDLIAEHGGTEESWHQHKLDWEKINPFPEFHELAKAKFVSLENLERWEEEVRRWQRDFGILCLCRNGESAAMWAHYGANGAGYLLEYDDCHDFFSGYNSDGAGTKITVEYRLERTPVDLGIVDLPLAAFFGTKSKEWEYENEVRFVRLLQEGVGKRASNGFWSLIDVPREAILSVTLGHRMSPEHEAIVVSSLRGPNPIPCYRAKPSGDDFRIMRILEPAP